MAGGGLSRLPAEGNTAQLESCGEPIRNRRDIEPILNYYIDRLPYRGDMLEVRLWAGK